MKLHFFETYLEVIKKSSGAKIFQNFFGEDIDGKRDLLEDGELSCSYFVSSILYRFGFIDSIHLRSESTIKDMLEFGWEEVDLENLEIGDVVYWDKSKIKERDLKNQDSEVPHVGFYIGQDKVISHSDAVKSPAEHDLEYKGRLPVRAFRYRGQRVRDV